MHACHMITSLLVMFRKVKEMVEAEVTVVGERGRVKVKARYMVMERRNSREN